MTRTDVMASSRPQTTVGAASMRRGLPRALRTLVALPVVLLLSAALVAPATALAEETGATGYAQKPPTPTTTTTTPAATTPAATTPAVTPASGTSPSKEASTPSSAVSPSTSTTSSTPTTKADSSKDLPFTGFDLRWTVGIGLLLMGVGFSIVTIQRRERRDAGS
jgi:uncharacterized membrane protein